MSFQNIDIVISICHQCNKEGVQNAIDHLEGPKFPSWEFISDFINGLAKWSTFCLYWEDNMKKYTQSELKELCGKYSDKKVSELEHIYDHIEL